MTQKVVIGKNSLEFWVEQATVVESTWRREPLVSDGGGSDMMVNFTGATAPVATTRNIEEVWVRLDQGGQDVAVQLARHDLPVRPGHRLSICQAAVTGGYPCQMVGLANHTTGESLPVIPRDLPGWVHDMSLLYGLLLKGGGYLALCAFAFWLLMSRAAAWHSEPLGWLGLAVSGFCIYRSIRAFRSIPERMDAEAVKFAQTTRRMLEDAKRAGGFASAKTACH